MHLQLPIPGAQAKRGWRDSSPVTVSAQRLDASPRSMPQFRSRTVVAPSYVPFGIQGGLVSRNPVLERKTAVCASHRVWLLDASFFRSDQPVISFLLPFWVSRIFCHAAGFGRSARAVAPGSSHKTRRRGRPRRRPLCLVPVLLRSGQSVCTGLTPRVDLVRSRPLSASRAVCRPGLALGARGDYSRPFPAVCLLDASGFGTEIWC